ncbi:uncharacterized protein V1510DRAFT_372689 [Dipodascopsis tothii]|uniref:uncharacterized protein n=1 Tax=Dipodascopsis tothii TaxID=44089 RepID=UPI0034CE622E
MSQYPGGQHGQQSPGSPAHSTSSGQGAQQSGTYDFSAYSTNYGYVPPAGSAPAEHADAVPPAYHDSGYAAHEYPAEKTPGYSPPAASGPSSGGSGPGPSAAAPGSPGVPTATAPAAVGAPVQYDQYAQYGQQYGQPAGGAAGQPYGQGQVPPQGQPQGLQQGEYSYNEFQERTQRALTSQTSDEFHQPGMYGVVDIDRLYHTQPSNGMCFGPYLRYTNIDLAKNVWMGSVMVVKEGEAPYFQVHPSDDIGKIVTVPETVLYKFGSQTFYKYNVTATMDPGGKSRWWTYALTSAGRTYTYQFLVAGAGQREWRFMAFSCADFSLSVSRDERAELGGVGYLWEDVMQRHVQVGGLHAMLGGGDQIYADRMWKEIDSLNKWLQTKGKEARRTAPWTGQMEHDLNLAFFFYYTSHFDRPGVRDCLSQIPHVFSIDDHDIFDGYGSYPEYMQQSNVFQNIGRIAFDFYMLFQHHTTNQHLQAERAAGRADPYDLFSVTGRGYNFIKYLGPGCAVVGPDTRAERVKKAIVAKPTYEEIFARMAALPPSVKQVVIMLAVPITYPRLTTVENILAGVQTTKRVINGAWNRIGKGVSKVAGVISSDAEKATEAGFKSVKKAFGKSGMMSSLVSEFGEVDLLDDLSDHWTHENHDMERTFFVRNLQRLAQIKGYRVTFVSGDVHCCGMGKFQNPQAPNNHQLMYQVITSAISNVPPPAPVIRLLHNKDQVYLPEMGGKFKMGRPTDTKEDMLEFFERDVDGKTLSLRKLLGRRNYAICMINSDMTCAWDLYVQKGGGAYHSEHNERSVKYGPLVVPTLAMPAPQSPPYANQPQTQGQGGGTFYYGASADQQQASVGPQMHTSGVYGADGLSTQMQGMSLQGQGPYGQHYGQQYGAPAGGQPGH